MCKHVPVVLLLLFYSIHIFPQDTIRYSRQESEAVFLKENLLLLAEKLNISIAEAQLQQVKYWPNPNVTIDQVNLWAKNAQTGGNEAVTPLWKGFGRNQQFAIELEQLIETAGKRKKRIALGQTEIERSFHSFEEILRLLKYEFRKQLTELQYTQQQQAILYDQLVSVRQIAASYEKQVKQGNIPKSQLVRLKAQELEITQDLNNWKIQNNEAQSGLKTLMHLPYQTALIIDDSDFDNLHTSMAVLTIPDLLSVAKTSRADLGLARSDASYSDLLYEYEKAKQVPDLYLKGNYDRNGSTMLNFIGFGVALDLPVFNRNQGSVRAAGLAKEQSLLALKNKEQTIENELVKSYQDYMAAIGFRNQIGPDYVKTLEEMLEAYTKNFQQQNISVLEYVDFVEAYLGNRKSILEAARSVKNTAEVLNYAAGADVIQLN